jgi:hypothetical protein
LSEDGRGDGFDGAADWGWDVVMVVGSLFFKE